MGTCSIVENNVRMPPQLSFYSPAFTLSLDNNWSLLMNYLQGTVVSVKGDRGEKVSESASSLKAHAPSACGRSTRTPASCFFHGGKTKRSIKFYSAFCFSFALFMSGSGRANANNSSSRLICFFFGQNYRTGHHRGWAAESRGYHLVQITDCVLPASASSQSHSVI